MDTNTAAFEERNQIIDDVLKLHRFLGNMNYGDQFQRLQTKGQPNWEFEDKATRTTFKPTLVGEIADPTYGTLLKAKGNYRPRKNMPVSIYRALTTFSLHITR